MKRPHLRNRIAFAALCLAGIAAAGYWLRQPPSADELLVLARTRLADERYREAESLALGIASSHPLFAEARLIAGEAASREQRWDDARDHYQAVPRDGSEASLLAVLSLGEVHFHSGAASLAMECYRHVAEHESGNVTAQSRLAFLLNATGQPWEATPHYLALIHARGWTIQELVLLADLERPVEQRDFFERGLKQHPHDVLNLLGIAVDDVAQGRAVEAIEQLREIVASDSAPPSASALLGELLVGQDDASFARWHAALPPDADDHPDVWFVRGVWLRRQQQLEAAARCFWETLRRVPVHRRAAYHLGQVLAPLKNPAANDFAQRASDQFALTQALDDVLRSRGRDEAAMQSVVRLLAGMGRYWEAWAWASTAAQSFPQAVWPQETLARVTPKLGSPDRQILESFDLARRHDLSHLPLPDDYFDGSAPTASLAASSEAEADIRFDDIAPEQGIDFVYDNGDLDLDHPGARMFEQTGGGVGAVDYDLDGWPDLYFPQGGPWPQGAERPDLKSSPPDRLYRNRAGQGFVDVAVAAGCTQPGFGQGLAVGDFDNDGFPDLYVAQIGRNVLYHNNGDGTLTDVSQHAGLDLADWTTSCLMADLNADSHPDLFDVNYVDGPDVFTLLCGGYGCSPKNFDGVPDRLWINRGDGSFQHIPDATPQRDAKGLGIAAVDLDGQGRPSLLIANDQVPNFLLRNVASEQPHGVTFQNEGFVSGLAFNQDGLAMACMGIAIGDADSNGLIDFYISNFRDESNTLCLQDAPGLFIDSTHLAGLTEPSLPYVGWGTQFLDADLDGLQDLALANGHVDDYRGKGQGYHMPAQFFRNLGDARFEELPGAKAGSFFARDYLGRGMAKLDWDRDGRMDFAVSNIHQPAALAANRTSTNGHWINVRLRAATTARDAIGAVVTVTSDQRSTKQQLVSGDGYMASNDRLLQFGLGPADAVDSLTVQWPSGEATTLKDVPIDATLTLFEGARFGTIWRGARSEAVEIE